VLPNREKAVQLFRSAAKQGNSRAAQALKMLNEVPAGSAAMKPEHDTLSRNTESVSSGENVGSKKNGVENVASASGASVEPPPNDDPPLIIAEPTVSAESSSSTQAAAPEQRTETGISTVPAALPTL